MTAAAIARGRVWRWRPGDDRDCEEGHARLVAAGAGHRRCHRRMVHRGPGKARVLCGYVAKLTARAAGGDVRGWQTAGRDTVVAGGAAADDAVVIEHRACPA